MLMSFLYETHIHTLVGSRCGKVLPEEIVRRFHRRGYDGIFITDHFLNNPSTTVPYRTVPWADAIDQYCIPYERAKAEGDKIGLKVFFGFENSYEGNDILTYGLEKDWLKAHPEIMDMPLRQYCEFARSEGGLVVHAHPFREAAYVNMIRLLPRSVDAVEALNGNCTDFENRMAQEYAANYGLPVTGGSDYHRSKPYLCSTASEVPLGDVSEFCVAVRKKLVSAAVTFDGRSEDKSREKLCD